MFKMLCDRFAGWTATVVSGLFLLASLVLMVTKTDVPVDPAWVTVVLSGYPLLYLAIVRLVRQRWISSCLLISIAMFASLAIGELFAAGEVAFIMAIGALLEDMTVARAKKGLSALIDLAPTKARRLVAKGDGYGETVVAASELASGDLVRVLPGEKIPADGTIVTGITSIDQSVMTGESLPVDKTAGDKVFCGTINRYGSFDMKTTAVGDHSSLRKLIRMVEEAEKNKAPMQRIADKWSVWLVPIALGIAVVGFLVNLYLGVELMKALNRGVTVLVVFCPCALALATPTSIMAAIGQATKRGLIIKSGAALETMGKVETIAFDKTGTLTFGRLEVSDVIPFSPSLSPTTLLALAGHAESRSEHPLGKAIVLRAKTEGLSTEPMAAFQMEAGRGVSGTIDGEPVCCGSERFLADRSIALAEKDREAVVRCQEEGKAIVLVAKGGEAVGLIALSDVLRPDVPETIGRLKAMGVRSLLLTGDNGRAAAHFAARAGIDEVHADLSPEDKVLALRKEKEAGKLLAMLGDGINDAPALKTADVGIAMGQIGSDLAIEAADIAIMRDDFSRLAYLKRLAKTTISTIRLNISVSMAINFVAVTLSVLGLLNPVTGALVHNVGSCLVVLNAALLYDRKLD